MSKQLYNDCEVAIRLLCQYMPSADQLIKATLFHSIRVGTYLYNHHYDRDIIIAGFLHDMLEDTSIKHEIIKEEFGGMVLQIIEANTKKQNIRNQKERNQELIKRCYEYGKSAVIVKTADILDNYKYYDKIQSEAGLQYCRDNSKILFDLLGEEYQDENVINELKQLIDLSSQ